MRHVAAMSRPAGDGSNAGQLNRSRSMSVSVEICGSEKSQVPPASQAYPSRQRVIWSADVGRFTSAIVLRFILRSFAAGGAYSNPVNAPTFSLSISIPLVMPVHCMTPWRQCSFALLNKLESLSSMAKLWFGTARSSPWTWGPLWRHTIDVPFNWQMKHEDARGNRE